MKLARVSRVDSPDGVYYMKTRRARTGVIMAVANVILRRQSSVLLGLGLTDWLWWECQLAPRIHGRAAHVMGRTLCLPEIPGLRLADFLENTPDLPARMHAVWHAGRELRRLHEMELLWPDGGRRTFSHGDAHSANVLYDAAHGKAHWFDFEAVHAPGLSEAARRADDFRTLFFSAARNFHSRELTSLAECLRAECEDAEIRTELAREVAKLARRPTAFHLAQCRLEWERHQECCEVVQDVFGS